MARAGRAATSACDKFNESVKNIRKLMVVFAESRMLGSFRQVREHSSMLVVAGRGEVRELGSNIASDWPYGPRQA